MGEIQAESSKGWRVKLYQLENGDVWTDRGTGNVCCKVLQETKEWLLSMVDELDDSEILCTTLQKDCVYERQNENIILWHDLAPDGNVYELALSFQEIFGCQVVWDWIASFQNQSCGDSENIFPGQLPACSLRNIKDIYTTLISGHSGTVSMQLVEGDFKYLRGLLDIVGDAEDLDDFESLKLLAEIWRHILLLNDQSIISFVIRDDIFQHIAGVMEYDKHLQSKPNYKRLACDEASLVEVGQVMSTQIKEKCQKLYWLRLLKDWFVRPTIDEPGIGAIMIVTNHTIRDICQEMFRNVDYIDLVLDIAAKEGGNHGLSSSATNIAVDRISAIKFVRELFLLSRSLPGELRWDLYCPLIFKPKCRTQLSSRGIRLMNLLCQCLLDGEVNLFAAESLLSLCSVIPSAIRLATLQGPSPQISNETSALVINDCPLLCMLIALVEGDSCALIDLVGEVFKCCLEGDHEPENKSVKDRFLNQFYDVYFPLLIKSISSGSGRIVTSFPLFFDQNSASLVTSRRVMFEILCLCVVSHGHRMKYVLLRHSVLLNCSKVFDSPYRCMMVGALRLYREVIICKDDIFNKHIVSHDLLRPIVSLLEANKHRDNLLTSSILAIFEFIRRENVKVLVSYVIEKFENSLEKLCCQLLEGLKLRFDQNNEGVENSQPISVLSSNCSQSRFKESESEADYFSSDDGPNETAPDKLHADAASENIGNPLAYLSSAYSDGVHSDSIGGEGDAGRNAVAEVEDIPLPPLRSKFEMDDESAFFAFKIRRVTQPKLPNSNNSNVSHSANSNGQNGSSGTSFSFSMKKRPKLV